MKSRKILFTMALMTLTRKTKQIVPALLAVPALAFGLAACSDDSDSTTETVTQTVTTTNEQGETTTVETTTESTVAAGDGETPVIKVDGNEIDNTPFVPVRCNAGTEDGRQTLDYQAGVDGSEHELDVEIVEELLTLDDFSFENDRIEYEMDDAQKAAATVEKDGDTYRISGTAHEDDNSANTIEFEAELRCS